MTDEEATTKPCIGPAPHNTGGPGNPEANGFVRHFCSGSRCMAWRVEIVDSYQQNDHVSKKRPEGEGWEKIGNFWARTIPEQRIGFCGLAGPL